MLKNPLKKYFHPLARFCRDRRGNVTIELALVMSVMALLSVGGYDISRMAAEKHQIEQVARAAAQWGLISQGNATDEAAIRLIAEDAAGDDGDIITVTVNNACLCPDDSTIDCTEICTDGTISRLFLEVIVDKPFTFLFNFPGVFEEGVNLQGTARVRVR